MKSTNGRSKTMEDFLGIIITLTFGGAIMLVLTAISYKWQNRRAKELNARLRRLYGRQTRPARRILTIEKLLNGEVS